MHAPAHVSQESDSELLTKVVSKSRKLSIYIHFPEDRNCEVCLRTKIARAPCRRRTGEALQRAEKYGDLITANHEVLNEGCESGDNHRYAVVVQVLATQWNPCQTKTSQETEKNPRKFPEPSQKPKVIHTDNLFEFGKSCEESPWNHRTSTPHRSDIGTRCIGSMYSLLKRKDLSSIKHDRTQSSFKTHSQLIVSRKLS